MAVEPVPSDGGPRPLNLWQTLRPKGRVPLELRHAKQPVARNKASVEKRGTILFFGLVPEIGVFTFFFFGERLFSFPNIRIPAFSPGMQCLRLLYNKIPCLLCLDQFHRFCDLWMLPAIWWFLQLVFYFSGVWQKVVIILLFQHNIRVSCGSFGGLLLGDVMQYGNEVQNDLPYYHIQGFMLVCN